jgi:hypothetical protein
VVCEKSIMLPGMGASKGRTSSDSNSRFGGLFGRRGALYVGAAAVLLSGVGYAATASAGSVSADDSRATVVGGNINACPSGEATLINGGNTGGGVTVTVDHTSADEPNPYPAGGWTVLPAGTDVLTVTLPAGDMLNGDIYVKGGDGYNDYPGSDLTSLIPPVNTGGQIAGLSHFLVCGTLTPSTGSISVKKVVSGAGTGSKGTFTVHVVCTAPASDTTLTLSDGDTKTVDNLPDGDSCTVTETDTGGSTSQTYTVGNGAATSTAPTVSVTAGSTTAVTVTNTYAPGGVDVKKVVVGTLPQGVTTFPIVVDCDGTTTTLNLADGADQTVPANGGETCTVTETDSKGGVATYTVDNGQPGSSPASVVITNGQTNDVTVTNTFTPVVVQTFGSVSVTKDVTGTPPANLTSFDFSLDCGGVITPITVAGGATQTVNNIPDGTSCTLTETDSQNASTTTFAVNGGQAGGPPTFTVNGNETTAVTVDNDYLPATLTVTKAVTGSSPAAGPFSIDADCGAAGDFTFNLSANGSHQVTGLPGGTTCSVTETDSDGATSTDFAVDGTATVSPAQTTLGIGGASTVAITNNYPITPADGTLVIKKVVDGTGSGSNGPFTVTANCGAAGIFTFTGLVNGSIQTKTVPAGTTCTVTETDADGATSETYTVDAGSASTTPANVTVPSAGTTTVTVTNIFVTPTGALSIHKAVNKTSAKYGDNLTYTLVVAATGQATEHNVVVTDKVPAHTKFVSAHCSTSCSVTGPTGHKVTWHVGDMAPDSSVTLTMVVNVTDPANLPSKGLPIEIIKNQAVAASTTKRAPSNTVRTDIDAVLGETVTRHKKTPSAELPLTGYNAEGAAELGLLLMAAGTVLTVGRRRRLVSADLEQPSQSAMDRLRYGRRD